MAVSSLISNIKTPIIYWYQNDAEIVLRVMIHDVNDYYLRVKTDEFEFSTRKESEADYYVYLHLFGAVIAEKVVHRTTGREITIYLPKVHKWTPWPRLLLSTLKSPQIFFDVDHIDAIKPKRPAFVWSENDLAEVKKNYGPIMPDVPSSNDEEDSDDEGYNVLFD